VTVELKNNIVVVKHEDNGRRTCRFNRYWVQFSSQKEFATGAGRRERRKSGVVCFFPA
jgi:hypothetical protein